MKFEYNGNLSEEDRIHNVIRDIVCKYPEISTDQAREIALLEGRISEDYNVQMNFNRLYNIMLVLNQDINLVKKVYLDLVSLLTNNRDDKRIEYYYNVTLEISKYLNYERDFPFLDEFEDLI